MNTAAWLLVAFVVLACIAYKKGLFDKEHETNQPEVAKTHAGRYTGEVRPPDSNHWGDGTNPHEAAVLVENPEWRGLGYRLGGSFDFVVATDGKLTGEFTLWGNTISIISGQIPAGQSVVSFAIGGATGDMTFDNGSVKGRICEPHDCEYKYGNILGARVA